MERTLKETIIKDSKSLNLKGKVSGPVTGLTGVELLNVLLSGLIRLLRISEMAQLKVLNLSHNELAKLPRSTSNLRNLTTLNLNHNKLTQFPEVVITLINLRHLFLNDNQLSILPANIKNLEKLEELELRNNKIRSLCKYIVDLDNLEMLSVTGNPLAPEEIRNLMILMDLKPHRTSLDIAG